MEIRTGKIRAASPMVSIVVPVYNAEKTIRKCVDSILSQEYIDFELLLIDDGSSDLSGKICDGYAKEDSRVRVIHKENTGVSASRNLAIERAKGKYLQFVDSDDWVSRDATRSFVECAEKYGCDMVVSDFYRVVDGRMSQKGNIPEHGVFSLEEYAAYMMKSPADFYYGVLWNKLYRRDIVMENRIRMNPSIKWCEDFMFNLEYLRHSHVFYSIHSPLYYYVRTSGSLSSPSFSISSAAKIKRTVFECYNDFYKSVLSEEEYEKMRFKVYRFLLESANDGKVSRLRKRVRKPRVYVSREVISASGELSDIYRSAKLFDILLEPLCEKYELTLKDFYLMQCLMEIEKNSICKQDLADKLYTTPQSISRGLQKLASRGFLTIKELISEKGESDVRKSKRVQIILSEEIQPLLDDLEKVSAEYCRIRFSAFTEEEKKMYICLENKLNQAVRDTVLEWQEKNN